MTKISDKPYVPETARTQFSGMPLSQNVSLLRNGFVDVKLQDRLLSMLEIWKATPQMVKPIQDLNSFIDVARSEPHGDKRITAMNTILSVLGQPENLATYLDMLRDSANRVGSVEQLLCQSQSMNAKMHSIYGWCGNTLLAETSSESTEGTHSSAPGLGERLGNSPTAWNITVHVWQPNSNAKGFPAGVVMPKESTILEPPHSHPFDFASTVVKGVMHQSIYQHGDNPGSLVTGYYDNIELLQVDGVWPPHEKTSVANLKTIEHRVKLEQGDRYYMPCDSIHDVEIDGSVAVDKPTITLFLSSEYMIMPHAYLGNKLAEHHENNDNLKENAGTIPHSAWHEKLIALASYLRGESKTLSLNDIVKFDGSYAFFHV